VSATRITIAMTRMRTTITTNSTTTTAAEAVGVTAVTVRSLERGQRRIHPAFGRLLTLYFQGSLGEAQRSDAERGYGTWRRTGVKHL
jgi:DNA-binding XRE family transcriptional regulator